MAILTLNTWKAGILGLVVGDALGVPVEFTSREERRQDMVTGMRAYGTHNQPAGTWSDDSSMVFATLDSINQKRTIDYQDIMEKFSEWCLYGEYTPFHEVFDIGITVSRAIIRYGQGVAPVEAGGNREFDNGNGSLMRILPVCLYLYNRQKVICASEDESIYIIHNVSALTHAHLRSQMACGFYYFEDGNFSSYFTSGDEELKEWIQEEKLEMFFKEDKIEKDTIKDLAGTGDIKRGVPQDMNSLLDNYIGILEQRERRL